MKNRIEIIEEIVLRENIRKILSIHRKKEIKKENLEEATLRRIIRNILVEKIAVGDEAPHVNTGINKLRDTLKKIIPQIRDAYLDLTTDREQRVSYINHLINGIKNLLAPIDINIDAGSRQEELEEKIDISINREEDKFIDIGDNIIPNNEKEEEISDDEKMITTGLEASDNDLTGRNTALETFKQIQNQIVNDFSLLANDDDREMYYDYLLTNILLWKDRFEEILTSNAGEEITTDEYEKEKEKSSVIKEKNEYIIEILD